ncbi:MAG: SDR family NAD(P)-dependent oxidoreductase [Rhodospirillales bacterium]|nr:SDR family NAD(P)-dependent oxidoreductase [Rhodospirillales bacterium]
MAGPRLDGRIALITGASRGIGRAVALRFAREGAKLILVARTSGALEELDDEIRAETGQSATLVPMDLRDFDAIDKMGGAIYERFGKLDVLVGNAGILGPLSPMGHIKARDWAQVMDINLTANWRLLRSFDPLLRKSDAGRCVFVTSTVGAEPRAYWSAYAVSKAALEMMTKIYALEIADTPVRANLLNPGGTRTAMRALAMPGENPQSLKTPDQVTDPFVALAEVACPHNGMTMDEWGAVKG